MAEKIKVATRQSDLPKPHYKEAMAEMHSLGDRGCVIVGTAYLDIMLRSALEHRIRRDAVLLPKLFENRGALQDFSARIAIAYAFEIIGYGAYADLNIMREIRNAFAHSAESVAFDRNDVAERCRSLWFPATFGRPGKPALQTPRDIFILGVEHIADGLFSSTHPILSQTLFIHHGPCPPEPSPTSPKKQKPRVRRDNPQNPTDHR